MRCAFDRGTLCTALSEKKCHKCSFRKTTEELDEGREKAEDRIASLPEDKQEYIRFKYNKGRKSASVWEEEGGE